jgi:hypothetical protein
MGRHLDAEFGLQNVKAKKELERQGDEHFRYRSASVCR